MKVEYFDYFTEQAKDVILPYSPLPENNPYLFLVPVIAEALRKEYVRGRIDGWKAAEECNPK